MIEIDPTFFYQFFAQFEGQSTLGILYILLFKYWLWVLFVYIFIRYLFYPEYRLYIAGKWASKLPPAVILAIDVPKRNEQSIQAMENFFDHLQGAHSTFTKWGEYIEGEFQRSLSVELVSIEGNIQFLIRCPGDWRNLVEAAVYSQFPDAEITEVDDYVHSVPKDYPNDTHDMWGVEFTLSGNPLIPLKSWQKFEHRFSETFVDPMAAMLETMSSIGPGEQIWIQYLLTPLAVDWGIKDGRAEVDRMMGKAAPAKKSFFSGMFKLPAAMISEFTEQLAGVNLSGEATEEKKQDSPQMYQFLTAGQKEIVEGIERKTAKWAFNTKIRYIYIYEKDKSNKAVGVNGVIGSIKQWTDVNTNGLKPDLKTTGTNSPQYVLINYRRKVRKNRHIRAYINRDTIIGSKAKPMCSEELASLWHFPSMYVKAPLLKKTDFTKAAAPVGLPIQEAPLQPVAAREARAEEEDIKEETQIKPTFDYDSDEFEMQFAKDKEAFKKTRPAREERLKEIDKEDAVKLKEIKKEERQMSPPELKESAVEKSGDIPGNLPFID